jgi:large subunit ribosomal protein L17
MRHNRVINHLGRTSSHRKSMLSNMATSLIIHKRITTTTAKAKALRMFVEPIITKSKEDSTHSRRMVFSYLKDKEAVSELFREVSPKIADRKGGYTRILKIGNRLGDNADMCIMELVDYNEAMLGGEAAKTKTTRRRRSTGKKKDETVAEVKAPKAAKAKVEKPAESADDSAAEEK